MRRSRHRPSLDPGRTIVIRAHHRLPRPLPTIALALLASACQSSSGGKGEATGKNVTKAADEIQLGIGHLDATLAALNGLVNEPAPDLGTQFKAFSKHLDQLDATAKKVRETAASMDAKGKAYFADWDTQIAIIQNEDIRERSADRRKAVEAAFSKIQGEYGEARDTFRPLMNDLLDIRTALAADLTMDGVSAIKKSVKKVSGEAEDVKENLQELADGFRKLGVSLSKSGPPKPAPEPEKAEKK
jgi:uncharacterized phage infection (PIP) family protein YhgE